MSTAITDRGGGEDARTSPPPRSGAWILLAAVVLAPLLALITVFSLGVLRPADTSSDAAPEYALAQSVTDLPASPGTINASWTTPAPAVASGADGVVTAVADLEEDRLASGERLYQVNGQWVVAAVVPTPFYRDLAPGDSGPDVAALNALLTTAGLPSAAGSKDFTSQTAAGVKRLAAELGAPDSSVFSPAWTVWVDPKTTSAPKLTVAVGSPAPAAGTPVIEFAPTIASARVQTTSATLAEGAVDETAVLQAGSREATVPVEDFEHLQQTSAIADLEIAPGTEEMAVMVTLSTTAPVFAVSPASLVNSGPDSYCLWARGDGEADPNPHAVTVVGSMSGTSLVSGLTSESPLHVLLSPATHGYSGDQCPTGSR